MIPLIAPNLPSELLQKLPSPCFAIDEDALARNMRVFKTLKEKTGAELLLALKGFSSYAFFDLLRDTLDGVCASGLWEAELGHEFFGKRVHTFSPAYTAEDLPRIIEISDSILFNSFDQLHAAKELRAAHSEKIFGLRVNPEYAEVETELYNPCSPQSRLGIRRANFQLPLPEDVCELHFHALCEQNADTLEHVLTAFEERFADVLSLPQIRYVNFGGGHHVTRPDYDLPRLIRLINTFKEKYQVQVILEPGEAVALNAGVLVATVLDIIDNPEPVAILDISVSCHMPDVLEMPYRPTISNAGLPGTKPYSYILGGNSCLAGDICGTFAFDEPLKIGDRLVFWDMAHYTTVKTTFFNGVKHPALVRYRASKPEDFTVIRSFSYADFKAKLG